MTGPLTGDDDPWRPGLHRLLETDVGDGGKSSAGHVGRPASPGVGSTYPGVRGHRYDLPLEEPGRAKGRG